ncbi:zinc finger, CCHC-type containing protein [Tanacetum coccineum]
MPAKTRTRAFGLSSLVRPQGLSNPWRIFSIGQTFVNFRSLINLRVASHAINARRLPLAPLVYTLVRPLMTTSSANNSVFRGFFKKQKLTGPNFIDWIKRDCWTRAHEMLQELKTLFAQQAEHELLQTVRELHSCKQEEGQSISSYVLKMKGYIDNLEHLGHPVSLNLEVSLILISLRKEFGSFVQNYNMHSMGKTINEFHAMLKLHEKTLPKNNAPALHAIRAAELLKKKNTALGASGSGIFTIELNTFLNTSWIYDTGCGTHICNTMQGIRASRKLKPRALSLYVGNSQREAVEAIGVFHLCLLSGLEIVLNNCHYAPSITRGVILVSRLYDDGFVNCFVNNTIQVSRNNMVYFSTIPRDGIFEIDLSNSYANDTSMYAVSNKRFKLDLDSALLWHCRLGHISKKRIEKLQHD